MNQLLLLLHILSASVWLGAAMWVSGDVRRTLALGKPHLTALPARVSSALKLDQWAGAATVLTGVALIGWQEMALGIHPRIAIVVGLVLAVVRLGLAGAMLGPTWKKLAARIGAGEDVPATDPGVKRLAMVSGIGHLLWVLILGSMLVG